MILKIMLLLFVTGLALAVIILSGGVVGAGFLLKVISIPIVLLAAGYLVSRVARAEFAQLAKNLDLVQRGGDPGGYRPQSMSCEEMDRVYDAVDLISRELRGKGAVVMRLEEDLKAKNALIKETRSREERFRRLFEQANDAMFIYDAEGKINDVNQRACEMMGHTREQLLTMSFLELHTDEELSRMREARVLQSKGHSLRFEAEFRKNDGSVISVEISSGIIDPKKGMMQAVVTNITERKHLEKALKESEEKFRTFMETASDLMFMSDRDGKLTYVNEAMFNSLGYSCEEMTGMRIGEIMEKSTKEEYKKSRFELSKTGEITYEPVWEAKNRRKVYGEMKEAAIYDANGLFSGSRGVFRDISERKKVEKSQRLAQLGELAADVAHEVNNPVMIIAARAELSLMEVLEGKAHDNLKIILDQCARAKDIVQRLLKFAKPSAGNISEVDINSAIENTIKLLDPQFMAASVKVAREYAETLPVIKLDEKLMQEVFMNLLRNAQEAMPDGGTITVSTAKDGDFLRIDLKDTGTGISEDDMKKIFDPFFTTKENGTGLGLSVCYGIVKTHGGDLKYSSEPGKGTTATILLPLAHQ